MCLEMILERTMLFEPGIAYVALVWALACMRALMGFEVDKLGKRCVAHTTAERTLASMRTLMNVNITLFARLVRAEPAPV